MNWPSSTNRGTALLRSIHQSEKSPLVRDEYVGWFVEQAPGVSAAQILRSLNEGNDSESVFQRTAYRYTVLRERFFDDFIEQWIPTGFRQLLLLGAGFDTRAQRLASLKASAVRVVEVDTPDTIATKVKILTEHLGSLPTTLRFVAMDFTAGSLGGLFDRGLDGTVPTICIWQGVSYYLPPPTVLAVLNFAKRDLSPGSLFGFDCCTPLMLEENDRIPGINFNIRRLKSIGEPYRFGMFPEEMKRLLEKEGFSNVAVVDQARLETKYLESSTMPDGMWYVVTAHN